ncbi:MAG: YHS domain-containing protein [Verrucomicrobia bacterium]|nr:YHS domain-containing protein [Verrucomicrobiota bacterium]
MNTRKYLLAFAFLLGLSTQAMVQADEQPARAPAAAEPVKATPYPLKFCVVSDEKFEGSGMTPFEMVYEGQTMKFCCKNCVKDFKKEPKKYLTKLAEEVKKQDAAKK